MMRRSRGVRPLRRADRDAALAVCARDPAAGVYVAARICELDLDRGRGSVYGYDAGDGITALCWASANIVPVGCDEAAAHAFAGRLKRHGSRSSSIFGPAEQVAWMWEVLEGHWRRPMDVRVPQPLLAVPPESGVPIAGDERVRPATMSDLDVLLPAAEAMFTEEIGYAPYSDSVGRRAYRDAVRGLVLRGHSFVLREGDRIVFKADIGSLAVGACQIQGVWIDPIDRGKGLAAPAMATVVTLARRVAPLVSLYVNGYNAPALAAYRAVGFTDVGTFATILF